MVWTNFMDMHSGGDQKLQWAHILIEAPKAEARAVFWHRFRRNPDKVTCTCCGEDYAVSERSTLEQATGFARGCDTDERGNYIERRSSKRTWNEYLTVEEYLAKGEVLIVRASEIEPHERTAKIPAQGYVWVGDDEGEQ